MTISRRNGAYVQIASGSCTNVTNADPCHQKDTYIIRDICESCDSFPFCDKVDYLRDSEPGSLHLRDLGIYQERWDDDDISKHEPEQE